MSSVFDPQTFAQMTFTGANSTEASVIPEGEWLFLITKQEIISWSSKDKSKQGLKSVLTLETGEPEVTQVTGRPKSVLRYDLMLDLTPEGGLDQGKGMNVRLGRAREACGLNRPGMPFAFDMFLGHTVKAAIKHEIYEGQPQARVTGIAPA